MRNDLLKQIVVAAGGTVTDPSNRNELLKDWLNAVSAPSGRWYFSGNGVDQYIETGVRIVDVDNLDGTVLEGVFDGGNGTFYSQNISGSISSREFQIFENGGAILLVAGGSSTTISSGDLGDGLYKFEFQSGSVAFYFGGDIKAIVSYTVGAAREPSATFRILARGNGGSGVGFLKSGTSYNHKLNDGSVYNYLFDDSFANNPVARNTGSGANATYINATEASWSFE